MSIFWQRILEKHPNLESVYFSPTKTTELRCRLTADGTISPFTALDRRFETAPSLAEAWKRGEFLNEKGQKFPKQLRAKAMTFQKDYFIEPGRKSRVDERREKTATTATSKLVRNSGNEALRRSERKRGGSSSYSSIVRHQSSASVVRSIDVQEQSPKMDLGQVGANKPPTATVRIRIPPGDAVRQVPSGISVISSSTTQRPGVSSAPMVTVRRAVVRIPLAKPLGSALIRLQPSATVANRIPSTSFQRLRFAGSTLVRSRLSVTVRPPTVLAAVTRRFPTIKPLIGSGNLQRSSTVAIDHPTPVTMKPRVQSSSTNVSADHPPKLKRCPGFPLSPHMDAIKERQWDDQRAQFSPVKWSTTMDRCWSKECTRRIVSFRKYCYDCKMANRSLTSTGRRYKEHPVNEERRIMQSGLKWLTAEDLRKKLVYVANAKKRALERVRKEGRRLGNLEKQVNKYRPKNSQQQKAIRSVVAKLDNMDRRAQSPVCLWKIDNDNDQTCNYRAPSADSLCDHVDESHLASQIESNRTIAASERKYRCGWNGCTRKSDFVRLAGFKTHVATHTGSSRVELSVSVPLGNQV